MSKMESSCLRLLIFILLFINMVLLSGSSKSVSASQTINAIPDPQIVSIPIQNSESENLPIPDQPIRETISNKPIDKNEIINNYVRDVCAAYNKDVDESEKIEPELIMSVIYHESRYDPKAKNGKCIGLMQVSTYWHQARAEKLGVTDFYDPHSNILLGVDYLSELLKDSKDIRLALMYYSMKHIDALEMYKRGEISVYAKSVLATAEVYKKRK
jgi:soluble lytic murein transglycosylase-like protein